MKITFEIEDKDIRSFATNFSESVKLFAPYVIQRVISDPNFKTIFAGIADDELAEEGMRLMAELLRRRLLRHAAHGPWGRRRGA